MDEKELVEALKSQVDPLKKEVSEYKSSTETKIIDVKSDLSKQYTALEEQIKAKADAQTIADLKSQIEGAESKYDALEVEYKKQGKNIEDLAVRVNESTLPGGSNAPRMKNMQGQIQDIFKKAETDGRLGELNNKSWRETMTDGQFQVQEFNTKAAGVVTNANLSNGYASRQISDTVVRVPANATHIRTLLPINTMTSAVFEYPQENTPAGEGSPGYQGSESTLKPQVDYDVTMVQIKPVTIAAWMSVSRQALQDISWLSGYASRKMTEDLLNFEDQEILMGANGSNQLNGLIPQATAYVRTDGTWNTIFEYLIDAISQQETINLPPTGILLHPRDYAQLLRYKTSTGEFDFPGLVFAGDNRATLYFMGLPIYKNNKIPRLTGLVGDWNQAELLVREGITFDVSYEDSTNFRQNLVTLRIEERIALADYIPRAFTKINFATILS